MTSPTTPTEGPSRIVVALDESRASEVALKTAIELAAALGRRLFGIFVEDQNLLNLSQLPQAGENRLGERSASAVDSTQMLAALRVQAARARRRLREAALKARVSASFEVTRGVIAEEIRRRLAEGDLLILGRTGRSPLARRRLGSTASQLCREGQQTVMLVQHASRNSPLLILYRDDYQRPQAIALAELLRRNPRRPVTVVESPRQVLQSASGERAAPALSALQAILSYRGGLIVSKFPLEFCQKEHLERFLEDTNAHVLILKATARADAAAYDETRG